MSFFHFSSGQYLPFVVYIEVIDGLLRYQNMGYRVQTKSLIPVICSLIFVFVFLSYFSPLNSTNHLISLKSE